MATEPYRVVAQRQTSEFTYGGRLRQGIEVTFVISSGTEASVFVPDAQYTPDTVRALVQAKANTLAAVEGRG